MLGGSAARRPRSVTSARPGAAPGAPAAASSSADVLVPGERGGPPVPLRALVAAWEDTQDCYLNLGAAVAAAAEDRGLPSTMLVEAALSRYAAESGLFEGLQDAIVSLTEPPLVPNPFPDAVRHFRRCGQRLEVGGLSARQFVAESRNEIALLAPPSPVHYVRERYAAADSGAPAREPRTTPAPALVLGVTDDASLNEPNRSGGVGGRGVRPVLRGGVQRPDRALPPRPVDPLASRARVGAGAAPRPAAPRCVRAWLRGAQGGPPQAATLSPAAVARCRSGRTHTTGSSQLPGRRR